MNSPSDLPPEMHLPPSELSDMTEEDYRSNTLWYFNFTHIKIFDMIIDLKFREICICSMKICDFELVNWEKKQKLKNWILKFKIF